MPFKIFCAVVAVALVLAFLVPIAVKLQEVSLALVMAVGVSMMLVDLWQSLRSQDS
jgi:hypothetical protein